jgi:hypothetical protein
LVPNPTGLMAIFYCLTVHFRTMLKHANSIFLSKFHNDIEEQKFRVLRRIFGLNRNEVTGGCRKLHNEELH